MGTILLSLLVFLATIFIPFFSFSAPDELLLQPGPEVGKDTFVWWWYENNNYGDYEKLWIFGKPGQPPDGDIVRSYVEFVELEPYVNSGYECQNATLSLYWYSYNHDTGPSPWLCVYRVAGSWEEDAITWNNRPGFTGDPCVYYGPPPEEVGWVDVDVTEIVSGWFSGEYEYYGFVFRLVDKNHSYRADFYSSDNPHDEKPKLYVEYCRVNVQPMSIGQIKAICR